MRVVAVAGVMSRRPPRGNRNSSLVGALLSQIKGGVAHLRAPTRSRPHNSPHGAIHQQAQAHLLGHPLVVAPVSLPPPRMVGPIRKPLLRHPRGTTSNQGGVHRLPNKGTALPLVRNNSQDGTTHSKIKGVGAHRPLNKGAALPRSSNQDGVGLRPSSNQGGATLAQVRNSNQGGVVLRPSSNQGGAIQALARNNSRAGVVLHRSKIKTGVRHQHNNPRGVGPRHKLPQLPLGRARIRGLPTSSSAKAKSQAAPMNCVKIA